MGQYDYTIQQSDVLYQGDVGNGYSLQYYHYYDYGKDLAGYLPESYADEERLYRQFVYNNYTYVDEETRSFLKGIIAEQGFSLKDPDLIKSVAAYVQNAATYNLSYTPELDKASNAVIAFLSKYKEGVCRHYAASATMLFRTLGIPARYVIGYMGSVEAGEWSEIKTPGHAWVEVYLDGIGWLPVEVTGGGYGDGAGGFGGNGGGGGGGDEKPKDKLTLMPAYQSKPYDGKPLYPYDISKTPQLVDLLEKGYTYDVVLGGSQTEIGRGVSVIESFRLFDPSSKDVTDRYELKFLEGVLEVLEPDLQTIRVYLYQLQKYYNGTPLAFEEEDYEIIEIPADVRLELALNISLTDAGYLTLDDINSKFEEYASFRVYRGKTDVTEEFRVVFDVFPGTPEDYVPIRVDARPLELTANSVTKPYDGKPLNGDGVTITLGSLLPGHHIENVNVIGSITRQGSTYCVIDLESLVILDAEGNDVTDNYKIVAKYGTLTVVEPLQKS
jgi:hypothetical protein